VTHLRVIGAGVCGVAAAYEACRQGLDVVLVDRGDIAGGASGNSMRIAHGGLRYLQKLDLARSFESIRERRRLLRLAPHCVRPFPFRLDAQGHSAAYRALVRAGLLANDLVSLQRNRGVRADRRLPRAREGVWYDALIEQPERLLLDALHSAALRGSGSLEVRTYADAASVRADATLRCVGAQRADRPVVLSMNLVVPRLPEFGDEGGVGLRHPDDGRNVFVVSFGERSVIGTHDRDYQGDPREPLRLRREWIEDVLAWLRPVHPALARLSLSEVCRVHAGLLPGEHAVPSDRPRVELASDGAIEVEPVKWTTAWGVASRGVALALSRLGRSARSLPDAPLLDGGELCREKHGGDAVRFAVEREWAKSLSDVLLRRTGQADGGHPGRLLAGRVAARMQGLLDWSERELREQRQAFDDDPVFAGNVPD